MSTSSGVHGVVLVGLEWRIIVVTKVGTVMDVEMRWLTRNKHQSILGPISCKADLAR
jgi:hypothetical protein